jgi:hypothetical protein
MLQAQLERKIIKDFKLSSFVLRLGMNYLHPALNSSIR